MQFNNQGLPLPVLLPWALPPVDCMAVNVGGLVLLPWEDERAETMVFVEPYPPWDRHEFVRHEYRCIGDVCNWVWRRIA